LSESEIRYPRSLDEKFAPKPVQPDLSVVIPTLGRPILETCLCYLAGGTYWPAQVVVVDQDQTATASSMLDRLNAIGMSAQYVPSEQRGRSAGINRGLERIRTPFVAITDDDCFVDGDWVERMAERLDRDRHMIITGRVEMAGGDDVEFSTVTARQERVYTRPQLKVHPLIGGNVGLSMEHVQAIGPFDEHPCVAAAEDSDYGYRALRMGIPIAYDPTIAVHHYHWRDASQRSERYADYASSQGGFYGTHLRSGDPLIFLQTIRDLMRSPIRWARGAVKQDRELAANGREHTLHLLPGIIAGLRSGKRNHDRWLNQVR
jgi:GT2 family glycosyltransferase